MTSRPDISLPPDECESASPKPRVCRYFSSRNGHCQAGDECQFLHGDNKLPVTSKPFDNTAEPSAEGKGNAGNLVMEEDGMVRDRQQATTKPVPTSRIVPKPVPQAQARDPREFQLGQIRRRFKPKETRHPGSQATLLKFSLAPSDPDFPFEMTALECLLSVPNTYPNHGPSLKVGNTDIPRGFALNVEHGFENLAKDKPYSTLLELLKALDKNLEAFLSVPKAETVKLVPNKDTRHLSSAPSRSVEPALPSAVVKEPVSPERTTPKIVAPLITYSAQEKAEAWKRREVETRQLEARMKRLPLYKMSPDGIAFTLPVEPKKRAELPISLQAVKAVVLFVPLLYPLQPCRIKLEGPDTPEAKPVEVGFLQKAIERKDATLTGHVNYLAQNMHVLAKTKLEAKPALAVPVQLPIVEDPVSTGTLPEGHQDPDRSHIQYITRPPEWEMIERDEASDSDDIDSYDTGDESSDEDGGVAVHEDGEKSPEQPKQPMQNPERGTSISFPFMELYGIELLEIVVLNITVKCERCKDVTEVKGLKDGITKSKSCKKCASPLSIQFRKDLIHVHAVRAGFLDLEGCVIGDMLASTFIPTCSQCSNAYPLPGIVSVQGESTSNVCRTCYTQLIYKIPSVKFLRITSSTIPTAPGPRRKRETLGLTPGTELPKRGRCRHYTKSYRWFRFSCCMKVYACDKCHEEGEDHPNEWANRMICGHCSREQNYRPEDCGFCRGSMMARKSVGGFWEGGKGTRDRVKMSRKDKRKHRRIGGGAKPTE
ncbi:hypothetical protein LZ554_000682 [Drepanopeziza brunnea f. sp. 'monogermtubi']|nr:hypothetical protein LZ554_000682 [Drepanopeziza brunnea f. sp. 'monogermtubi']